MVVVVGGGQELEDHFSAETFRTKHLDLLSAMGEGQRGWSQKWDWSPGAALWRPQAKTHLSSNRGALQAGAWAWHPELTPAVAGCTGQSLCSIGWEGTRRAQPTDHKLNIYWLKMLSKDPLGLSNCSGALPRERTV